MRIIYIACFILWGVLAYKFGEMQQRNLSQVEFELITEDALLRIQHEKTQLKTNQEICALNEMMCVEKIEGLEKDMVQLYLLLLFKEKSLDILLNDFICLKKEEA
jgi:hypothetical protein